MHSNIIHVTTTIREALKKLDELAGKTLFIIDDKNKMVGTITDGDIRRGLLKNNQLESTVETVMSFSFKYITEHSFSINQLNDLRKSNIQYVPLLSKEGKITDVIDFKKISSVLPLEAIIMAGGKGTRLQPLTLETPKPLLNIGGKPIIEYNIDRLIKFGIKTIYISVNYLKDQIIDYFGDGSNKGITIKYIEEEHMTGTLGSVTYVDSFNSKDILVMNSDLLTNINFENLYQSYISNGSEMAVATIPYDVTIPYGVVETKDNLVVSLKEKPTYTYYSNAGIYIISSKCINEIPKKTFYNATELIDKLIKENRKVINFPILDYWLDIGKPHDYEKAQKDIHQIKF